MPGLVEVLSSGVQLVQQLGDPWHQALGIGVADPGTATAAAAAAAAAAVAVGEGLAALNALQQPGGGFNMWFSVGAELPLFVFCFNCFNVFSLT